MKYELVNKTTDEVVDTIDYTEGPTPTANYRGAKLYFVGRKQLEEEEFDKLFSVKVHPYVGRYDWWKEESTGLDDF
jgi:hypothetical protein|tara:strand:- start:1222 stop:1449 length:228 start_codon:yes stop_codon:yes gene_type:complete